MLECTLVTLGLIVTSSLDTVQLVDFAGYLRLVSESTFVGKKCI